MKIKIPIRLLNIEGDGFHLQVKMVINGKKANAILDTGASKTVFDKTRIHHFLVTEKLKDNERLSTGLGTASMQSHVVVLKNLKLGKLSVNDYPAVVLDLNHVNQTYLQLGLEPIDGVIGSDLLNEYSALVDYGKKVLVLKTGKKEKKVKKKKSAKKKPASSKKKKTSRKK